MIWASGQVNADMAAIEKALQASGSKVKLALVVFGILPSPPYRCRCPGRT